MKNGNTKRTVAVIQARMGSSRLPGKILLKIAGKSMLEHIAAHLRESRFIDMICVATTENPKDDALIDYLNAAKIAYYRGSENDIVSRLYQTAVKFNADTLVRVWGDCPLIDSIVVDRMLEKYFNAKADFASNDAPPTYPFGMNAEVYSVRTLKAIFDDVKDPFYREFPFEYIKDSNRFKAINVAYSRDVSHISLTVDYKEDAEVISRVIESLKKEGKKVELENIIEFCEKNKSLFDKTKKLSRNIEYNESIKLRKSNNAADKGGKI